MLFSGSRMCFVSQRKSGFAAKTNSKLQIFRKVEIEDETIGTDWITNQLELVEVNFLEHEALLVESPACRIINGVALKES